MLTWVISFHSVHIFGLASDANLTYGRITSAFKSALCPNGSFYWSVGGFRSWDWSIAVDSIDRNWVLIFLIVSAVVEVHIVWDGPVDEAVLGEGLDHALPLGPKFSHHGEDIGPRLRLELLDQAAESKLKGRTITISTSIIRRTLSPAELEPCVE